MNQHRDDDYNDAGRRYRKRSRLGRLRRRLASTTLALYVVAASIVGTGVLHAPHSPGSATTTIVTTTPSPGSDAGRVKLFGAAEERARVLDSLLSSVKRCEARGDEATAVTLEDILDVLDSITKYIECTPRERELAKALEVSFAQIEDTFKIGGSPTVYQSRILTASHEGQIICSRICDEPPDRRGE